jgi:hypothetical protein
MIWQIKHGAIEVPITESISLSLIRLASRQSMIRSQKACFIKLFGLRQKANYFNNICIYEPCHDKTNIMGLRPAWIKSMDIVNKNIF